MPNDYTSLPACLTTIICMHVLTIGLKLTPDANVSILIQNIAIVVHKRPACS